MAEYSLSDVASVVRNGEYGSENFNGGSWWIIVLFLFAFMGNGFYGNKTTNGDPVTESGLCNAMNFNNLENAVGRLNNQEDLHMMQLSQGMANLGYENLRNFADTQSAIKDGNYTLASQISECCCATQRAIDGVNYNNAINTAAINKNIDDKFAALEKAQLQQTIDAQNQKISQLELAQQMATVVRYPTGFNYNAGSNPFCGGCGYNNI